MYLYEVIDYTVIDESEPSDYWFRTLREARPKAKEVAANMDLPVPIKRYILGRPTRDLVFRILAHDPFAEEIEVVESWQRQETKPADYDEETPAEYKIVKLAQSCAVRME